MSSSQAAKHLYLSTPQRTDARLPSGGSERIVQEPYSLRLCAATKLPAVPEEGELVGRLSFRPQKRAREVNCVESSNDDRERIRTLLSGR